MADNFLQAINTGINLGHMADSARMQRVQMERMAEQMRYAQFEHLTKVADFQEKLRLREETQAFLQSTKPVGVADESGEAVVRTPSPQRLSLEKIFGGPERTDLAIEAIGRGEKLTDVLRNMKPEKPLRALKIAYGPEGETKMVTAEEETALPKGWGWTKPPEEKEVNIANDVDTFLGQKFPGYYTDKTKRKEALDYYSTPQGADEFNKFWAKRKLTVAPTFNIIQTPTGFTAVNTKDPQRMIDLGIKRPLSSKESDDLSVLDSINISIQKAKSLYDPSFVGPVAGRLGNVAGKLGVGTSEQEQSFRAANAELEKTLFDLGGKQLTENEIKVLTPFIPNVKDPPITYRMKVKNFELKYNDILQKKVERLNQSGFGIPRSEKGAGTRGGINIDIDAINKELNRRGQ